MTTLTKLLIALLVAVGLVAGVQTWRVRAAQRDAVESRVAPAKAEAAVAKQDAQAAAVTLTARIDTVTRWLRDTVRVPARALRPTPPADTARAVAALPVVTAQYQACRAHLLSLVTDCDARSLASERRFRADSVVIATQDAVLRERKPRRHWSLGITGGYGVTLTGDRVVTGPSITAGLTWTPF